MAYRLPIRRGVWRTPGATRFGPRLERAIQREQNRYGVSRSFVLNNCAAFALGVEDEEPSYKDAGKGTRTKKGKRS